MGPGSGTSVISGPDEPVGPQLSTEESPQELPGSLEVKEFERKSRDMLGVGKGPGWFVSLAD